MKIKLGDKVRVFCASGLGGAGDKIYTIEKSRKRYNKKTGKQKIQFKVGDQWFDDKGNPATSPWAYYISKIGKNVHDN